MAIAKPETLKDIYIALAAKRGLSKDMLTSELWEAAESMTLVSYSSMLGLTQEQSMKLLQRDFDRLALKVN